MSHRLVRRGARSAERRGVPVVGGGTITDGRDIEANKSLVGPRVAKNGVTKAGGWAMSDGPLTPGTTVVGDFTMDITNTDATGFRDLYIEGRCIRPFTSAKPTIEYCKIGKFNGTWMGDNGVLYGGYTLRYCEVGGFSDGLCLNGDATTPTLVEYCWVHYNILGTSDDHNDAAQMTNGSNTTLRGNLFDRRDGNGGIQTSCNLFGADASDAQLAQGALPYINDCLIEKNLYVGINGFQRGVQVGHETGRTVSNVVVRNNFFATATNWAIGPVVSKETNPADPKLDNASPTGNRWWPELTPITGAF